MQCLTPPVLVTRSSFFFFLHLITIIAYIRLCFRKSHMTRKRSKVHCSQVYVAKFMTQAVVMAQLTMWDHQILVLMKTLQLRCLGRQQMLTGEFRLWLCAVFIQKRASYLTTAVVFLCLGSRQRTIRVYWQVHCAVSSFCPRDRPVPTSKQCCGATHVDS